MSLKWKDKMLSSGLPLEYEIGKILAGNNFAIDFDYSYKRLDNALEKEFSVDVKGGGYYPFEIETPIELRVDLLVECKYRNPNVSWLFVPDINIDEFTSFSSKGVVKVLDEFTELHSKNSFQPFPSGEICLKGIEVNIQTGEVHDTGLKHGINQLTFALPDLIRQYISSSLTDYREDVYPYVICPILVTTAELRILKPDFSISEVSKSSSLDDISDEVPYLRMYSDVYPSFQEHCRNVFKNISYHEDRMTFLELLRKVDIDKDGKLDRDKIYSQPMTMMYALKNGIGNDLFRETLVCNLKNFSELLTDIKTGVELIANGMEKIS